MLKIYNFRFKAPGKPDFGYMNVIPEELPSIVKDFTEAGFTDLYLGMFVVNETNGKELVTCINVRKY